MSPECNIPSAMRPCLNSATTPGLNLSDESSAGLEVCVALATAACATWLLPSPHGCC
jgi:hypothetical protein